MKLDPRILDDKQPLTIFNTDIAKTFIGCKGFFANDLARMRNLDTVSFGTLIGVKEEGKYSLSPFASNVPNFRYYQFFLPEDWVKAEWVKEPEKKYRPFSLEDFLNIFHVGDLIHFRRKNDDEVKVAMFTGYITDVDRIDDKTPGAVELMLGIFHYSLFSLFDEGFEVFFENKWQPFGVLVKED